MCHRNAFLTLLAVVLSLGTTRAQATKTLTGRLLDDQLEAVPMANIYAADTTVIGKTDMEGYFKLDIPRNPNTLLFGAVGLELTTVKLNEECSHLEVILLLSSSYDFRSARRVNRKESKRFKHLPQLHQEAYKKGLFKSPIPCAFPIFTKWVPRSP